MRGTEGGSPRWQLWLALVTGIASGYAVLMGLWIAFG